MGLFNSRLFIYFSTLAVVAISTLFSTAYAQPCFLGGGNWGEGQDKILPQIATPLASCVQRAGWVTTATLDISLSNGSTERIVFWDMEACQSARGALGMCKGKKSCTLVNTSILFKNPYVVMRGSSCNNPIKDDVASEDRKGDKGFSPIKQAHDKLDYAGGSRYGEAAY